MKTLDKSEKELLQEIANKLDKLIALTAVQGLQRDEKIKVLVSLGSSNSEIADMLGLPKGTVDSIRAKMKKGKVNA